MITAIVLIKAEPQVLMLPDPVRRAVLDWALRPQEASPEVHSNPAPEA